MSRQIKDEAISITVGGALFFIVAILVAAVIPYVQGEWKRTLEFSWIAFVIAVGILGIGSILGIILYLKSKSS